jgi:hypothetical protein
MTDSTGNLNKAIRELRRELHGVHGDASVEKQDKCMEILESIKFYTTARLLFDDEPTSYRNDITLSDLTRGT